MGELTQGFIAKKFSRKTKNPKFQLHSFKLEGDDKYYSTKFDECPFDEGTYISFTFEESQNGQYTNYEVDNNSLREADAPKGKTTGGTRSNGGAGGGVSRDQYWANKEERDVLRERTLQLQGARTHAIEIVTFGIEQGMIPAPKGKKAEQLDVLLDMIEEVAMQLSAGLTAYANADAAAEEEDAEPDVGDVDWDDEDDM